MRPAPPPARQPGSRPAGRAAAGSPTAAPRQPAETDLYPAVRDLLTVQGFTVRGEVRGCDVVGQRGDVVVIVELKRAFNATLLMQAVRRQRVTDNVYVAIPRPRTLRGGTWKGIRVLVSRLELGLILVDPASAVPAQVVCHPTPHQRRRQPAERRAVLAELGGRTGDRNVGGSVRRPLITAYREAALFIAWNLERQGPCAPARLRALGCAANTTSVLATNVYGWFEKVSRGLYRLGDNGRAALDQHADLVEHFAQAQPPVTAEP